MFEVTVSSARSVQIAPSHNIHKRLMRVSTTWMKVRPAARLHSSTGHMVNSLGCFQGRKSSMHTTLRPLYAHTAPAEVAFSCPPKKKRCARPAAFAGRLGVWRPCLSQSVRSDVAAVCRGKHVTATLDGWPKSTGAQTCGGVHAVCACLLQATTADLSSSLPQKTACTGGAIIACRCQSFRG